MDRSRTRNIVLVALGIALMAVSAQITVPIGAVPFTLQTLVIVLVCLLLEPLPACAVSLGYVLLGLAGLPIFAGFKGGLSVIVGPTGGFIIAFVVCMAAASFLRAALLKSGCKGLLADIAAAVVIICISYLLGWAQLRFVTGMTSAQALLTGVAPFVVPDVIKAAVAVSAAAAIRKALSARLGRAA